MKRFSPSSLYEEMNKCCQTGNHKTAVIVYSQSNWPDKKYSEKERSYLTHSDQWGWDQSLNGRQILGECLDGSEKIRLDHYDWEIEGWYWFDENTKANEQEFEWTLDALINLQYITAYIIPDLDDVSEDWPERFDYCRKLAEEFTLSEPADWGDSDVDYETAIQAFLRKKTGRKNN